MKVMSVSSAKTKLGRVIDDVIKSRQPIVIPRGGRHVVIMPYDLPTPEEMEFMRVFREVDRGREPVNEDEELAVEIQSELRKVRAEKRRGK
jgi:hypothetical protein